MGVESRKFQLSAFDGLVKSAPVPVNVIPAQAGIQSFQVFLDSRLRGSDGSGAFYESITFK
jgi:hypothetical protein